MRAWWTWMTIGALISLGYPLLPDEGLASIVVYNGMGVLSFLVLLIGVWRNRPPSPGSWLLFAAGLIMFVSADIVYEVSGLILGSHPYPYWDDLLYFLAYPLLWVGLLRTGRGRSRRIRLDLAHA